MKKVIGVYRNQQTHWVGDGFLVKSLFSYDRLGQAISPFLLLDYAAPHSFIPTQKQRGVGSHPHRGFETVTLAYQGEVSHQDSSGGGGTIHAGDVQWMTAGAGIVHEEFHSPAFAAQGGIFEMVQLWINLPAKDKMTPAHYQALKAENIPMIRFANQTGHLRVIAGHYAQQHGPASTFSPVNVWDGALKQNASYTLHVPREHTTLLLVLQGELVINGTQQVQDSSVVMFARDADPQIELFANIDTCFVILTGEPLHEPIQGYGPFVMNTKQEIVQAFNDFNQGKFG
ncbi:pirin family protein [Acinetobacter sp. B51(2017)]|uniref:pirin family protein n=1 Tax=Acinetobacter sp. B51(2017) TaxID=2060938 RepID=UPI000F097657|nr:pirin family protein [Acinetobacter sp. B51(2017)]